MIDVQPPPQVDTITAALLAEWGRAKSIHGDLPSDPIKVIALMTEELGEVSKSVLAADRCRRRGDDDGRRVNLADAYLELLQLANLAALALVQWNPEALHAPEHKGKS